MLMPHAGRGRLDYVKKFRHADYSLLKNTWIAVHVSVMDFDK